MIMAPVFIACIRESSAAPGFCPTISKSSAWPPHMPQTPAARAKVCTRRCAASGGTEGDDSTVKASVCSASPASIAIASP